MPLTPIDIHNKQFRRAFFGYSRADVDEFLNEIIDEFERLIRENHLLREQLELGEQRLAEYRNLEETLQRALVAAQESADQIKANARREAELILQEARLQAERLIEAGKARAQRLLAEHEELQRRTEQFRAQLRSLLLTQLELLERLLPVSGLDQAAPTREGAGRLGQEGPGRPGQDAFAPHGQEGSGWTGQEAVLRPRPEEAGGRLEESPSP
ncbi:MAG: DivIVA domain-containing protein [Firmicutes bacterium]|nr:DivIVA domain-containing protein [Bacillota bacterium]